MSALASTYSIPKELQYSRTASRCLLLNPNSTVSRLTNPETRACSSPDSCTSRIARESLRDDDAPVGSFSWIGFFAASRYVWVFLLVTGSLYRFGGPWVSQFLGYGS